MTASRERGRPARTKPGTAWAISPTWINRERRHGSTTAWPLLFCRLHRVAACSIARRPRSRVKAVCGRDARSQVIRNSMRAGRPRSRVIRDRMRAGRPRSQAMPPRRCRGGANRIYFGCQGTAPAFWMRRRSAWERPAATPGSCSARSCSSRGSSLRSNSLKGSKGEFCSSFQRPRRTA